MRRLPPWLKRTFRAEERAGSVRKSLRRWKLHTVCQEAKCPNRGECYAQGKATFLILGRICTRRCAFCGVTHGSPEPLMKDEPDRIAQASRELDLEYVVITSVTRDDLPDGGATHFARAISKIREFMPECGVEVLTPDFNGDSRAIELVAQSKPDVFSHNIETVSRLYGQFRPEANYRRSLELLALVKSVIPDVGLKSGLMVGLGETREEIEECLEDLRRAGCQLVTIGQYLPPLRKSLKVVRFVPPSEFDEYEALGHQLGMVIRAGPFVRSSYNAEELQDCLKNIFR